MITSRLPLVNCAKPQPPVAAYCFESLTIIWTFVGAPASNDWLKIFRNRIWAQARKLGFSTQCTVGLRVFGLLPSQAHDDCSVSVRDRSAAEIFQRDRVSEFGAYIVERRPQSGDGDQLPVSVPGWKIDRTVLIRRCR